jgi:hypothetical protein
MVLFILIVAMSFSNSALKNYDHYEYDDSISEMSSVYTGPLVATGGAMTDINRLIKEMEPTKIGSIESNKIILIDEPNEVYIFNCVKYYKVTQNVDTFYVMKIDSKMNNQDYEIIIELRSGVNYDRTLNIYKNGKPHTLILWIENTRLVPKYQNKI